MPRSLSHIAVPFYLMSYGENRFKLRVEDGSVHAEVNAIQGLPSLPRNKRPKKVDLVVIRVTKAGCYRQSKPCLHCLQALRMRLPEKGYILEDIYYTSEDESIVSTRWNDLIQDTNPHITKWNRNQKRN